MNNFLQIASGVDVLPFLLEVQRQPELWDKNPARLSKRGPHHETQDIPLRSKDEAACLLDGKKWREFSDEHIPVWYKNADFFPAARKIIFDLMARVQGEMLGGVYLYRLQPGKQIYPHVDRGWHPEFFDKFNVCLQSNSRSKFIYENEILIQKAGDIHHFRNDTMHCVVNDGQNDHIVMVVTIRCDRGYRVPWSPEGWTIDTQLAAL